MQIQQVKTNGQVETVARLADEIWRQHYEGIVDPAQIDYMLATLQSADAISEQIKNKNYEYYLMQDDSGNLCGYFAFIIEKDGIFLSKIYVQKNNRKKGFAKKAISFMADTAKNLNLSSIYLAVARENVEAIEAYKKMNFNIDGNTDIEIGGGFFMYDYKMSLKIIKD